MKQVEQMRADGRVDMYAEANYEKDTTAYMWITNKNIEIVNRIRKEEKERFSPLCRNPATFDIKPNRQLFILEDG